jgi:uncharacterized protein YdaU (DUF1376 family)
VHYYKRNLGDYAKKAGRLSMLQHGAYTLLIDACYDREQFPTKREAIDWTWASSTAEVEAVEFVLSKFFVEENGVFVQKRIQEELSEYQSKSETNKRIALDRETNRKKKGTNRSPSVNTASNSGDEPPPNQEPLTKNHKPNITPDGFDAFWARYPKKTAKPAALKAFKAQKVNGELPDILADITRKVASPDWQKEGGQFIPNPATYLNQRRWEDQTGQQTTNIWAGAI